MQSSAASIDPYDANAQAPMDVALALQRAGAAAVVFVAAKVPKERQPTYRTELPCGVFGGALWRVLFVTADVAL